MCRHDDATTTMSKSSSSSSSPTRLLFTLKSYEDFGTNNNEIPNLSSCAITCIVFISFLIVMEQILQNFFERYQDSHVILQNETNRFILARHLGVDAISCFLVAILGLQTRHICQNVIFAAFNDKKKKKVDEEDTTTTKKNTKKKKKKNDDDDNDDLLLMPKSAHESRLYTYHPAAFRLSLFFFAYQFKNLYDTIIWNDGPEFIFHHIFSLFSAWGCMKTVTGLYYAIFFFGISEISTGILCILANFDDEYGVIGLGDAFPLLKITIGTIFVIGFIICRSILWPLYTYYFSRDILMALKINTPHTQERQRWLQFFLISLCSMTILQVAWLGQVFMIGQEELMKVGIL